MQHREHGGHRDEERIGPVPLVLNVFPGNSVVTARSCSEQVLTEGEMDEFET